MDLQLGGRVAVVTASSKGLGRAIAEQFALDGADVAMCARNPGPLAAAADSVSQHGGRVFSLAADVADADAIAGFVAEAAATLGGDRAAIDCLVVNAGGPPPGDFADIDDAAWRSAIELTLLSAVGLVQAALPALQRSDAASIVFVSSTSLKQPIRGLLLSNSIRMAVAGLAKSLAFELAPAIRVNTLMPGRILTDRSRQRGATHPGGIGGFVAEESMSIPLQRFGQPEEFAKAAVFLSSPAASYITGATLAVDGGLIQSPL